MDQSMLYRSVLRVSVVVTAFILVFQSGLIDERTAAIFSQTTDSLYATAVGASASVAPTELNMMTAQITAQQQVLQEREQQVAAREIELGLQEGASNSRQAENVTYILAAILFIQLILLVLNYVLDYIRAKDRIALSTQTT